MQKAQRFMFPPPISRHFLRVSLLALSCVGVAGYADTVTTQRGNSKSTVTQSDGSARTRTSVERIPNGQKVITRTGNSTDITIQTNEPSGKARSGDSLPITSRDRYRDTGAEDCPPRERQSKASSAKAKAKANPDCDWEDADAIDDFENSTTERTRSVKSVDDMEKAARSRMRPVPSVDEMEARAKDRMRLPASEK